MNLKFASFIFTVLFFCHSYAQNQNTVWLKSFPKTAPGSQEMNFTDIVVDQLGNTYVIGVADASYDVDPSFVTTAVSRSFLAKYSPNGNLIFVNEFGSNILPRSIALDEVNNNVYVAGSFSYSTSFLSAGPSVMIVATGNSIAQDGFVSKFSTTGTFNWVKTMGGNQSDQIFQIAVDSDENLYMYGRFGSTSFNLDMAGGTATHMAVTDGQVIWKVTNNGSFLWSAQFHTSNYTLADMILDANNNLYAVGSFKGTVDFDPSSGVLNKVSIGGTGSSAQNDVFVQKLNSVGQLVWVKSFGGNGIDTGTKICFDGQGNIATAGKISSSSVDADPGPGITYISSGGNFVHKLTPAGDFVEAHPFAAVLEPTGFHCEQDGSYVVTGYDPTNGIYLTRMNSSGALTWTKTIGITSNTVESHASAYRNGSWYVVGFILIGSTQTLNFQVSSLGTAYNMTGTAGYLMKIYTGTCVNTTSTKYRSVCTSFTVPSGDETYTVSGTYSDTIPNAKGCDSIITFVLTIGDATGPVPNITSLPNVTEICSVASLTSPTATDNCAGIITGTHNAILPITTQGTTVITWTYDDGNGNTSTQTQNVVITDNTAPFANIASLADITNQCSVTSLTAPTATDNCAGTITGTHNVTLPITTQGTTIVTWTYDDGNGNTSTQTQNIVITDNIAPVVNIASLADITNQCSVTSLTAPTATDNCAGTIIGTHNALLPITTIGTTTVTWTYNDGHGNTSTQTQSIIISDNTIPVANLANLPVINSQCSVTSLTAPTATDNCAGIITGTHNTTLPITTSGTTVVTWTYDDGNGNTSTQTQNVVINDNTAPVANIASLTNVTGQCSVTSLSAPTATDNCAGTITGTHNTTLPITTPGTTVVTWTYDDGNGNTSIQTQNVTITDNTAPVANIASLADVTNQCSVTSLTAPTATDNCAGTITGTTSTTFPITTSGTTVVTWTYNDGNGNTSSQTQNVIVTVPVATTTLSGLIITATTSGATYQWINCGDGNIPISGATSQSYTATANGTYAVIVTQNGCSATSACVTISTVGLDELSQTQFTIYPNPNNGMFTIETELPTTITITNAEGKLISTIGLQVGQTKIDLEAVESGIYFIHSLDVNGQRSVRKISLIK